MKKRLKLKTLPLLAALSVVSLICLVTTGTFCWMTAKRIVDGKNDGIKGDDGSTVKAQYYLQSETDETVFTETTSKITFNGLIPDEARIVRIKFTNTSSLSQTIVLGMEGFDFVLSTATIPSTNYEKYTRADGLNYVLGYHLRADEITIVTDSEYTTSDTSNYSLSTPRYIVDTPTGVATDKHDTGVSDAVLATLEHGSFYLVNSATISPNATLSFDIKFLFVDNDEDQNVFMNDGGVGPTSNHTFFYTFQEGATA